MIILKIIEILFWLWLGTTILAYMIEFFKSFSQEVPSISEKEEAEMKKWGPLYWERQIQQERR